MMKLAIRLCLAKQMKLFMSFVFVSLTMAANGLLLFQKNIFTGLPSKSRFGPLTITYTKPLWDLFTCIYMQKMRKPSPLQLISPNGSFATQTIVQENSSMTFLILKLVECLKYGLSYMILQKTACI